jgi:hypothetical protein
LFQVILTTAINFVSTAVFGVKWELNLSVSFRRTLCLRRLCHGFGIYSPGPAIARFMVDKAALGQVFLRIFHYRSNIAYSHHHLLALVSQGKKDERWETKKYK